MHSLDTIWTIAINIFKKFNCILFGCLKIYVILSVQQNQLYHHRSYNFSWYFRISWTSFVRQQFALNFPIIYFPNRRISASSILETLSFNFSMNICKICKFIPVAAAGGGTGNVPPPPKLKKIVVEKWCYFRRLYF